MELETNLVLALNMMDVAQSRGHRIDVDRLTQELGIRVVPMIASRKEGHEELLKEIVYTFRAKNVEKRVRLYYGSELEEHITELETVIAKTEALAQRFPPRWLAIKLLESDPEVLKRLGIGMVGTGALEEVKVAT